MASVRRAPQLDVTRDQTDDLLREKQLVSGKIITGIHNLYMRCKMSMRGPQKVRLRAVALPPLQSPLRWLHVVVVL